MIERHSVSDQRSFAKNAKTAAAGFLAFFIALFLLPLAAHAAGNIPTAAGVIQGTGIPMVNLTVFLLAILRVFFGLLGLIAVALLIYGGFIWMTAGGDPGKVDKAKQIIYNTIIGLIIIFSAFAISSFLMAWLTGLTGGGGGGGTSNIPGGNGDWSRSANGAGPIQSVYPAPNAVNVPINTRIAVTFKVNIDPRSICDLSAGGTYCNGNIIKNVSICEISATGTDCLAGSAFNAAAFANSTVYQASATDQKTFIFYPSVNLGNDDQLNRVFKVVLGGTGHDIIAVATGKSVFDGLRVNYYNWAFKTNGILDLTPPEVAKLEIYPNPDNIADTYAIGTQSTAGIATVAASAIPNLETPVTLNGVSFTGTALSGISANKVSGAPPANYLKLSTAGFGVSSTLPVTFSFTVDSDTQGKYIIFDNAPDAAKILGVTFSTVDVCAGKADCLPVTSNKQVELSGSGIIIISSGNFSDAAGSTWTFTAAPARAGDSISLQQGPNASNASINFIFASSSLADQITKRTIAADGRTVINTSYFTVKSSDATTAGYLTALSAALNAKAGSLINTVASTPDGSLTTTVMVRAIAAGQTGMSLSTNNPGILTLGGNLSGTPRVTSRTALPPGSKPDPYNNSVFRVSFTEAVNPINVEKYIKVRINGVPAEASTTFTNQYQTLELTPTKPCGINSCGKQIYCWLDPNADLTVSIPASTTITAATLKSCTTGNQDSAGNEWCKKFGGACQAGVDGGRCKSGNLYYPQADATVDGIIDMANNSFNGNFDKATSSKGFPVGNAQGQTGIGNGKSGQLLPYNANDPAHFNGLTFSYANDGDTHGDDFSWSYFISTQIDTAAPLLAKIIPYGDYSLGNLSDETFHDPVRLVFNGLMRLATLQPGWGYGENKTDPAWNTRYLILKTMTTGANPVGYWVSSVNKDEGDINGQGRGDGLADFTEADVFHNPFDQAVSYGPLAGNGIESITQNCFLPGNGPQNAGAVNTTTVPVGLSPNTCFYKSDGTTQGCVTDPALGNVSGQNRQVTSTNPASYGYMECADIDGALACDATSGRCKAHYATSTDSANGSWIITKDFPIVKNASYGATGCCFGKCF